MITWDIAQSAVLYCGLLLILLWRLCFPWQHGKTWKKKFNHFVILYVLVSALYLFELVMFLITAHKDFQATSRYASSMLNVTETLNSSNVSDSKGSVFVHGVREWPIFWLRFLVMCVPVMVPMVIIMTGLQSKQHLDEIGQDSAQLQHDRVINILALPAVYAVVVMSGLSRVYELAVDELVMEENGRTNWSDWKETQATSFAEYETCIFVGDLYEAWALFQFGKLTMELLENAMPERTEEEEDASTRHGTLPSRALSVKAISSVMWLGSGLFIGVNLVQTGWALYMWFFENPGSHWDRFQMNLSRFSYAGMVASAAAIYNVHIVESTFGHFIKGYAPFLKFLSVKILVFFAFWQGPCLAILQSVHILHFTDVQMKLLQATLLVFECLFCACLHVIAWGSQEQWYAGVGETTPLLDHKQSSWPWEA